MKNKKGFTLVELLAVIVIMAILVTIAVPSAINISNKLQTRMFCSKIDSIKTAAEIYGEEKKDSFTDKSFNYTGPSTIDPTQTETQLGLLNKKIKVMELVNTGKLKKDNKTCGENLNPCVVDPRNKDSHDLENMEIVVYVKYNRIYVHFPDTVNETCNLES